MPWLILACGMCAAHSAPQDNALWSALWPTLTLSVEHRQALRTQTRKRATPLDNSPAHLRKDTTPSWHDTRWSVVLNWDLTRAWRVALGGRT